VVLSLLCQLAKKLKNGVFGVSFEQSITSSTTCASFCICTQYIAITHYTLQLLNRSLIHILDRPEQVTKCVYEKNENMTCYG